MPPPITRQHTRFGVVVSATRPTPRRTLWRGFSGKLGSFADEILVGIFTGRGLLCPMFGSIHTISLSSSGAPSNDGALLWFCGRAKVVVRASI